MTAPDTANATTRSSAQRWRGWAIGAYCTGCIALLGAREVPVDRERVILIIVGALVVTNVGRPWRDVARVLFDWLPFTAVLFAYDLTRGLAHRIGRPVAYTPQISVEKFLFFGKVPTVVLQEHFYFQDIHWWDVVAALVYVSHFIVPFALAGVLWRRDWPHWRVFATRFVAVSFSAVVIFAVAPTAPPWAAAKEQHRFELQLQANEQKPQSTRGLEAIGLRQASKLIDKSRAAANPYAAIPSLHSGFALLVAITLWPRMRRRATRLAVAAYPLLMVLTLVYTGEHYVVDALVGFALVTAVARVERRTRARRWAWWRRQSEAHWPRAARFLAPPGGPSALIPPTD